MSAHNKTHTLGPVKESSMTGIMYQECLVCLERVVLDPSVHIYKSAAKKIKELHLDIYHMRGDTVDVSIAKIEDKINEIIEFLNKR